MSDSVKNDLKQLQDLINKHQEEKDYNLEEIMRLASRCIQSSKDLEDIRNIKETFEKIKSIGSIGRFVNEECSDELTKQEAMIKEKSAAIEKSNTIKENKVKKRAKLSRGKNGKVVLEHWPYWYETGLLGVLEDNNQKLRDACIKFQSTLGFEEYKRTDEDESRFSQVFSECIDNMLAECHNEEEIETVRKLLKEMGQAGILGEIVYNKFYNQISLQNVAEARIRKEEREEMKKEEEEKQPKVDYYEIEALLAEYNEEYEKKFVDGERFEELYERGRQILAKAQSQGAGVTGKLKELMELQENTRWKLDKLYDISGRNRD